MNNRSLYPDGTRVRLYPQPPGGSKGTELETVYLSPPAGTVGPGPSDGRMYAVTPIGKDLPYGLNPGSPGELYLPPWDGPVVPPPRPGPDGHFDHLDPSDPGFAAVHLYGCVRFTLDVWEDYLGEEVRWHFDEDFDRLELSMVEDWPNAQMGYGYLETGSRRDRIGRPIPYALNFDIIAHEVGHAVLMALTGPFVPGQFSGEFEAFHEMSADWVALIASLHFDTVIDELLVNTSGNLDTFNRFSRFAEVSHSEQIRLANNDRTMADYAVGWDNEHHLAKPMIAAFFDIFVDLYHEILLDWGAVSASLEHLADQAERDGSLRTHLQRGFDRAFQRKPEAFKDALAEARDMAARYLIEIWMATEPDTFGFGGIPALMEEIDEDLTGGRLNRLVQNSLQHRGIGLITPGLRNHEPGTDSHMHSARTLKPYD